MRRSRRYSSIEASKQILGTISSESDSESDISSDGDSMSDEPDEAAEISINNEAEWNFITPGEDDYNSATPYTGDPGLTSARSTSSESPENNVEDITYFIHLFLNDDFFNKLCLWTNKRAELAFEKLDVEPDGDLPDSVSKWHPVSMNEMKKFFGIMLCMSLNKKPELRNYWSLNLVYRMQLFQDNRCLSRNRFLEMRYLRFCDYDQIDESDSLAKILPFLKFVQNRCKSMYTPKKDICVDESLLLFKGRIHFRRYIPSKRARYGILSYCLCESDTGYTWNIEIAAGREDNLRMLENVPEDTRNFTFSEKIVLVLIQDLLNQGYHLYVDNFFTSVRLAMFLFTQKTLVTGTIRSCRGVPEILKTKEVKPKSVAFCRRKEVLCVKSVDRKSSGLKTLYMVDTANKAATEERTRTLRGGIREEVKKSLSVLSYNKGMGGVDQRDGSLHQYNCPRKSFKWFTKVSMHLFHVLVRNSWIVYRSQGGRMDFLGYQEKVIDTLVLRTGDVRRAKKSDLQNSMVIASDGDPLHTLKRLSPTPTKPRPAKRCRVCYMDGKRKETVFVCGDCPDHPALCVDPCFRKFHHS